MTPQEIKTECEKIWKEEKLIYPIHVVWWSDYKIKGYDGMRNFYIKRGKRINPK